MNFIVVGGGCYGTYYCRQLLRGAEKLGLEQLVVVDHDPNCQVRRELVDDRILHITQDWRVFLQTYFAEQLQRHEQGLPIIDHYVPPCIAPHILFETFEWELTRHHPTLKISHPPVSGKIGTPVDMALADGNRALSFAEWICPHSCIEPRLCPVTRGPKDWDMREHLVKFFAEQQLPVDSYHLFSCRHLAMGVGTIPWREIVVEFVLLREAITKNHEHRAALATISSCHGLVGLMETYLGNNN